MKEHKEVIIESILERINNSPFMIVTDYNGITVDQFTSLRDKLRERGAECHVAKNSFVKRALRETEEAPEGIEESLTGQTAIVTGDADVCAAAKVLKDFAKEFSKPEVKSGMLDGKLLSAEDIKGLADLPPREVLLAQLLGVLSAPASKLVRTLNEPASALARILKAKEEKDAA